MGTIHLKMLNPIHFAMKRAKWQAKPHGDLQDRSAKSSRWIMKGVLMWGIKCRLSLYLRFSINCLIFNMFPALVAENRGLTPFIFNMFPALAFY
jgi:hypothetical protein